MSGSQNADAASVTSTTCSSSKSEPSAHPLPWAETPSGGSPLPSSFHDLLPDSFAPLLSSSQTEVVLNQLTPDLLHGLSLKGSAALRPGKYSIPLNKDAARPQLTIYSKEFTSAAAAASQGGLGCQITVSADIGSGNGWTIAQDFDVLRSTTERPRTMLRSAEINFGPPALALYNVAPTLIHLPSLFQDTYWTRVLERVRHSTPPSKAKYLIWAQKYIRLVLSFLLGLSSVLERFLWFVESKCQIHLSRVRIIPHYKQCDDEKVNNQSKNRNWRLQLSFSGYILLCDWIPVPFINVRLPTFIIPAPYAFLKDLISRQPLATAQVKHENLSQYNIITAILDATERWSFDIKAVATPPAFSVDVSVPGGMTVAVEAMLGRDISASLTRNVSGSYLADSGSNFGNLSSSEGFHNFHEMMSYPDHQSISSWDDHSWLNSSSGKNLHSAGVASAGKTASNIPPGRVIPFDANNVVPWTLELSLQGTIDHDRVKINLSKCRASHQTNRPITSPSLSDVVENAGNMKKYEVSVSGGCVIHTADPSLLPSESVCTNPFTKPIAERKTSAGVNQQQPEWMDVKDKPSVCATLLFPDHVAASSKVQRMKQLLQYDYSFDIAESTNIDAVSISVGVSHPMLHGSTIVTTVFESIYAWGTVSAREGSMLNPYEPTRKRNLLKHIPAIDFTAGIQNAFIPEQSLSYIDDGISKIIPQMKKGRMAVRITGGFMEDTSLAREGESLMKDVVKVVVDFGVGVFSLYDETKVNEVSRLSKILCL